MENRELLRETICALSDSGVENAGFEAKQLLELAGIPRMKIITDPSGSVSETAAQNAKEYLKRRLSGEPLQYIIGEWEFYGLPFKVGKGVLIPRQDTEVIVDIAREFLDSRGMSGPFGEAKVLDLCAGSGCIGITLAKYCNSDTVLVEKSFESFGYLQKNIALNGVEGKCSAVLGDCFDEYGEFDAIVSNPPYLTKFDMENLQREVRFEPELALYGGVDGLDYYRMLLRIHAKNVRQNGLFAVEIGIGEEKAVMEIFRENGFEPSCEKDLNGIYRVVYAVKT
ncbi:MAG: peptide chain release factor N(5)-glutamine methyltransferase [Oscillospiraceae bacterium]|nr:peptide chain release factor N(5)-glutamine methyltransferase [Oscillospiraceae bacterium]